MGRAGCTDYKIKHTLRKIKRHLQSTRNLLAITIYFVFHVSVNIINNIPEIHKEVQQRGFQEARFPCTLYKPFPADLIAS